ncbi:hypothetical protein FGG08_000303 [Glutinoglossum americanum]|uniref:Integral membrane protein n=1 Tax=Glutinoglossum americanum TaxID=1670608 RepID=A0A9P8L669_9PEZI|nr:hypothetical protein FGG08_000303 [Glutinoglossum americanum]
MWLHTLFLLTLAVAVVTASEVQLDEKDQNRQRCSGMYSRKTWGGSVDPFILTKFEKATAGSNPDPIVSFVIFEWHDEKFIGRSRTPDSVDVSSPAIILVADQLTLLELQKEYICDEEMVQAKYCNNTDVGKFILSEDAQRQSQGLIITQAIHLKDDPKPIEYAIKRTGYYCVGTYGYSADSYRAVVVFRNSYGELPAAQIPKLPFYGGLTITYAVIGAFWAFLYVQHRQDILPVQNYITAIIVFLIVEMLMTWGFYDYQNRHGSNALAKVLMIVVAVLNAGRNSFSFFLLLIVCMGYGVVKPSLGKTMLIVRGLAAAHFIFGVIYAVASLTVTPDSAGPLVLLVVLPLAGTLTAFYVWTLNALNMTMKDLLDRKQSVKAMMYKKLWWCILASILVIFGFFFLNSFTFAGRADPDFVPNHWKTRWFILDGWLNLVYLIAQDDEGFEIASFGGSLDDEEANSPHRDGDRTPKASEGNTGPAPKQPATRDHRESLDGEPIFAVGEDADKWSDDDESPRNSTERSHLTGKDT